MRSPFLTAFRCFCASGFFTPLHVVLPSVGSVNHDVAARLSGLAGGAIEFAYEHWAIRFGFSIDETEARLIVDRMRQRYVFRDAAAAG